MARLQTAAVAKNALEQQSMKKNKKKNNKKNSKKNKKQDGERDDLHISQVSSKTVRIIINHKS